jgi:DNA-binding response OmpR family regulator
MGTGILVVGEGADQRFLAAHLEAEGYGVACAGAAEALDVLRTLRPCVVLIAPGLVDWQRSQLCNDIREIHPDIEIVLLRRKRPAVQPVAGNDGSRKPIQ